MRRITIVAVFGLLTMMFYPILAIISTTADEEEACIPRPGFGKRDTVDNQ